MSSCHQYSIGTTRGYVVRLKPTVRFVADSFLHIIGIVSRYLLLVEQFSKKLTYTLWTVLSIELASIGWMKYVTRFVIIITIHSVTDNENLH